VSSQSGIFADATVDGKKISGHLWMAGNKLVITDTIVNTTLGATVLLTITKNNTNKSLSLELNIYQ
jgi:hypothetical protein